MYGFAHLDILTILEVRWPLPYIKIFIYIIGMYICIRIYMCIYYMYVLYVYIIYSQLIWTFKRIYLQNADPTQARSRALVLIVVLVRGAQLLMGVLVGAAHFLVEVLKWYNRCNICIKRFEDFRPLAFAPPPKWCVSPKCLRIVFGCTGGAHVFVGCSLH